jgi:hypothetical protein
MAGISRLATTTAILLAVFGTTAEAGSSQGGPLVLNGQLSTSDFSGGVGDRYGATDDYYPSSYFVMRGNGFRGRGFGFPHGHFGHGMGHGGSHGGGGHR